MNETTDTLSPVEPPITTGYSPISKVIGTVAVRVLELTKVVCRDTPIVITSECVKFSPVMAIGTLASVATYAIGLAIPV